MGLHHALLCPVYSGRCLSEYFLALGVLMSYASECPDIIEADFMFYGVWVPHYMAEEFHSLLREALCGEGAFIFSSMDFLVHPRVGAFLFRWIYDLMIIGGFKSKNLSENFVVYGIELFEHTVREDERLT